MRLRLRRDQEIGRRERDQEPAFVAGQGGGAGGEPAPATAPQPCVSRKRTMKYSSASRQAKKRLSVIGMDCR